MILFLQKTGLFLAVYLVSQAILIGLSGLMFGVDWFANDPEVNMTESLQGSEWRGMVALNQIVGLLLPAVLFLLIWYGKKAAVRIGFFVPSKSRPFLLALVLLFFSYPLIQQLAEWNQNIPLSDWMRGTSDEIQDYMLQILKMEGIDALFINLLLIAVLPAFGEELFFRAVLQRELIQTFKNAHAGILVAAALFSTFHFQFDGFLPRLALGALFGYSYHYLRSFLIPVLLHFTHNAMLVWVVFQQPDPGLEQDVIRNTEGNFWVLAISLIFVIYLFYLIRQQYHEKPIQPTD